MPFVMNAFEIKSWLKRRDGLLSTVMHQALFRALQSEPSALHEMTEYPQTPLARLSREQFERKRPVFRFEANATTDAAIEEIEAWLKEAIRRCDPWLKRRYANGRIERLIGINRLEKVLAMARSDMAVYRDRDAALPAPLEVQPVLHFPDGKTWVQLVSPAAFCQEGAVMRHCIGNGSYHRISAAGRAQYFSLRDTSGRPRVTLEAAHGYLRQVKGTANSNPWPKWSAEISTLMEALGLQDALSMARLMAQPLVDQEFEVHQGDLDLSSCGVPVTLPRALHVTGNLVIARCDWLEALPDLLWVDGNCRVTRCSNLRGMPSGLIVHGHASFAGCRMLSRGAVRIDVRGSLDLSDCRRLPGLPRRMRVDGDLDITDCSALGRIPRGAVICGVVRRGDIVAETPEEMNRHLQAQAIVCYRPDAWRWSPGFRRH